MGRAFHFALAGAGGETRSTRGALQRISEASFGQVVARLIVYVNRVLGEEVRTAADQAGASDSD